MPSAQQIVLVDDKAANVAFTPNNRSSNGNFHFLNLASGQSNLADHLVINAVASTSGTSKAYVKLEAIKPVTDADTGITSPAGKAIAELTIKYPPNFTSEDRARLVAMLSSIFDDSTATAVLKDVEGIY